MKQKLEQMPRPRFDYGIKSPPTPEPTRPAGTVPPPTLPPVGVAGTAGSGDRTDTGVLASTTGGPAPAASRKWAAS